MPASISKKIRDTERLLKRNNITDDVKEALLKDLDVLKDQSKNNKLHEKERVLSKKYHKVKFFERKKVTRSIHRIDNQLKLKPEDSNLINERHRLVESLAYIVYYPRHLKYISLFVNGEGESSDSNSSKKNNAKELAIQSWNNDKLVS